MFGSGGKSKKRALTRDYLVRAAYGYLQRFATTEQNLRTVLERKARRRLAESDSDYGPLPEAVQAWIAEIVGKAVAQNLVNDRLYAEARAARLIRSGNSRMKTTQKLLNKGVAGDMVEEVLDQLAADHQDTDALAAVKYARKRRFGGFSLRHDGGEVQEKELASMCRAGFSYALATRVLRMSRREMEDVIYDAGL